MRPVIASRFQNSVLETQQLYESPPIHEPKVCPSFRPKDRGIREPDFIDRCEIGEFRGQLHYFPVNLAIAKHDMLTLQEQDALVRRRLDELRDFRLEGFFHDCPEV